MVTPLPVGLASRVIELAVVMLALTAETDDELSATKQTEHKIPASMVPVTANNFLFVYDTVSPNETFYFK